MVLSLTLTQNIAPLWPKGLKMNPKMHKNKKSENQKSFKVKVFSLYKYALKQISSLPPT